ncbi:integrase core domain-containing protein [Leucobacter komagatae]|uniref:integrase core domain-containing protein n=1 Tax=Leucobacter komagatae TaxID=55969 RepID=UPI0014774057
MSSNQREKVERFDQTLAHEWAYATTYDNSEARAARYDARLHPYNHHRPHTRIGGQTPSDRVHNLTGTYAPSLDQVRPE